MGRASAVCASFLRATEMRNLREYLNLSIAAESGELGELVKAASQGMYEGMRGEYAPLHIPKEDKPGLLSRRSAQLAMLGGAGSALPGSSSLVGSLAAGLHAENGIGAGTALATAIGSAAGGARHGVVGRIFGGALGASLGHEYFRRKAEIMRRRPYGPS